MDFDLEINFTGICAFIENSNPTGPSICVVMPSTETDRNALDDEHLCPHEPYIEQGFGFALVRTSLRGQRVVFDYRQGPSSPGNPRLPRLPIATYGDVGLIDLKDSDIVRPTNANVVSSRPPVPVVAQALLENGHLQVIPEGFHWAIHPQDTGGVLVAHEVVITLKGLEHAAAILHPLDGGSPPRSVDLRPTTGVSTVALRIANYCERSAPCRKPAYRDRDFKWYYEILENPETISLGNRDLPIPRFVSVTMIGGNNCFPARLEPVPIQG